MGGADKYNCVKKKTEPKPTGPLSHLPDDPGSVGGWLMVVGVEQNIPTLTNGGHHRYRHPLILQQYIDTNLNPNGPYNTISEIVNLGNR